MFVPRSHQVAKHLVHDQHMPQGTSVNARHNSLRDLHMPADHPFINGPAAMPIQKKAWVTEGQQNLKGLQQYVCMLVCFKMKCSTPLEGTCRLASTREDMNNTATYLQGADRHPKQQSAVPLN